MSKSANVGLSKHRKKGKGVGSAHFTGKKGGKKVKRKGKGLNKKQRRKKRGTHKNKYAEEE